MATKPKTPQPPMRNYVVVWETMTRANFELCGELVVKAATAARATARAREKIGYRYAVPDEWVDAEVAGEVIPRR